MKKKLSFLLIAAIMVIIPAFNVKAEVVSTDLAEAVEEELELIGDDDTYATEGKVLKKFDTKNYESGNAKVTVYVFRGSTCPHCLDAITHFASIYKDYSDKMDVVTYEVYNNSDNASLMTSVASALGSDSTGVPLIVIGDQYFEGYGESLDDSIAEAIDKAYENEEYVDVVQGVIDGTYSGSSSSTTTTDEDEDDSKSNTVGYIILGITVVIIVLIVISRGKDNSYYDVADAPAQEAKEEVKEEEAETKEVPVKKVATKKTTTSKKTSTSKKSTTTKKKTTKKSTKK